MKGDGVPLEGTSPFKGTPLEGDDVSLKGDDVPLKGDEVLLKGDEVLLKRHDVFLLATSVVRHFKYLASAKAANDSPDALFQVAYRHERSVGSEPGVLAECFAREHRGWDGTARAGV